MKNVFADALKEKPIIAGVKDISELDNAVNSDCKVIFLLCGNIFNLKESVRKAKEKNKIIIV